jgi:hypothetical protein
MSVRQRFASASQLAPSGSSPSLTDRAGPARLWFESERRLSVRKSCRSASSGETTKALMVKGNRKYLGQCRRTARSFPAGTGWLLFQSAIHAKAPVARHASVSAQNRIAARRISSLVPKVFLEPAIVNSRRVCHLCYRGFGKTLDRQDLHLLFGESPTDPRRCHPVAAVCRFCSP